MHSNAGKLSLGKGTGPKWQNGKLPDWMVVIEANPRSKIELSDSGPRCARTKNNIAAQLCDWGAMSCGYAQKCIGRLKIGNFNETTFFLKEQRGFGCREDLEIEYPPSETTMYRVRR